MADPFKVSVVSRSFRSDGIHIPEDLDLSDLARYDEEAAKVALLYADSVTLHSFRETVRIAFWLDGQKFRFGMAALQLYRSLLTSFDDAGIAQTFGIDPQSLPDRATFRKGHLPGGKRKWDPSRYLQEHLDPIMSLARSYSEYLLPGWTSMESRDLLRARDANLLTILPWHDGPRAVVEPGPSLFGDAVVDMTARLDEIDEPLFIDVASTRLTRHDSWKEGNELRSGDKVAAIMKAATSRLPGFSLATVGDILEIRGELNDLLVPFRAEMLNLATQILATDAASLDDVVASVWHTQIAPIVTELDYQTRRSRYMRELLGVVAEGRDALVSAAALTVSVAALSTGVRFAMPAAASAAYPLVKALHSTVKGFDLARKNRLYFLQRVGRRLYPVP